MCFDRKWQEPMALKCYKKFNDFFWGREDEEKMREKNGQILIFSQILLFGHILKKINTFTFWCMIISLGPHSVYTL